MKVTVRMTRQTSKKNSVKSISSHQSSIRTIASTTSGQSVKSTTSILRQSKSLANLNHTDQPSTSTGGETHFVKRSRTMDALLDIGAFSSDFGPENLLESSSEATLLCKESKHKRTRFIDEVYDNPLMKISVDESTGETSASFGSQNELQLFMDRPDSKDNLSDCHVSPQRSGNNSPICIISHGKSDFDTPQDSPFNSNKSLEDSEESQDDAFRKFQLGKCLKWRALQQRCSSKDSGYVTTPTSPCQDGDLLHMEDFKVVDETDNTDKEVAGIVIEAKRRDSFDSPANSSPSSVYPLSSIEESPPPKSRCERCDSLYLQSDDNSYYSHDSRVAMNPSQRTTWTQNISGLLRDTLANYLYAADRQQYENDYDSDQYHQTDSYSYPYPEYTRDLPEYNENKDNTPPSPSLLKKFFKKRTTNISTQTSGPPLNGDKRSTVNWHRENGTYMIKPREDAGMEFMGPIYLAKSVEDLGPFLSGSVMDNDLGNSSV